MDLTIRQRLLEFGESRVGDLGAGESERLQTGQFLKITQGLSVVVALLRPPPATRALAIIWSNQRRSA